MGGNVKPLWYDPPGGLERLVNYCETDVLAEKACAALLPEQPLSSIELWRLTTKINERGVFCDLILVARAKQFADRYERELLEELQALTEGFVRTAKQTAKLKEWLLDNGVELPSVDKANVAEALKREDLTDVARRVLEIRRALAMSSVTKLLAMEAMAGEDGRIRGTLLYHGASTGRFCLSDKHEVLTPEGWVSFPSWKGQAIAVFSPRARNVKFEVLNINAWEYSGTLIHEKNNFIEYEATPEHKVCYFKNNKLQVKKVSSLPSRIDCFPVSGNLKTSFRPDIETRVIVMVQADGSFRLDTKSGRCLRFHFSKERKIERCKKLLIEARIPFSERVEKNGSTEIRVPFRFLPKYLVDFTKREFNFSMRLSPLVFIDEFKHWDANIRGEGKYISYFSISENNANYVLTMAHLSNHSATIVKQKNHNWTEIFHVRVYAKNERRLNPIKNSIEYSGKVYCPETSTGFFLTRLNGKVSVTGNSGRGVQVQNYPRGSFKDVDNIFAALEIGDYEFFKALFPNVFAAVSSSLRGMLTASPGCRFLAADYNAIEARVVMWLANCKAGIELFESDVGVYEGMAQEIYGIKQVKDITEDQRQLGKQAILGSGFGMGDKKFKITCQGYGMNVDEKLAKLAIKTYREKFEEVVDFWGELNRATLLAVQSKKRVICGRLQLLMKGKFLFIRLPSGRKIGFYEPKIEWKKKPWGMQETLTYMAVDSKTKQWRREDTYGGKLFENCVQGIATDVMTDAMIRLEEHNYPLVLSVHDELVADVPNERGSLKEFGELMGRLEPWADGLPIKVKGWQGARFKKGE